jgi:hypothetical protein
MIAAISVKIKDWVFNVGCVARYYKNTRERLQGRRYWQIVKVILGRYKRFVIFDVYLLETSGVLVCCQSIIILTFLKEDYHV